MATVKIEFVNGAQTVTTQRTVSGTDLLRLIAAVKNLDAVGPNATNEQALSFLSVHTLQKWTQMVRAYEQKVAADAARDAVTPIGIS